MDSFKLLGRYGYGFYNRSASGGSGGGQFRAGRRAEWRGGSLDSRAETPGSKDPGPDPEELTCRRRTLKVINSRPLLITICTFVVIECACVLAELMVDLQGIKFRFENEEKEVERFVGFLKDKYPEEFATWNPDDSKLGTVEDVLNKIKAAIVIRSDADIAEAVLAGCKCPCWTQTSDTTSSSSGQADNSNVQTNSAVPQAPGGGGGVGTVQQTPAASSNGSSSSSSSLSSSSSSSSSSTRNCSAAASSQPAPFSPSDMLVLEINNNRGSFFLVAEYAPEHIQLNETRHHYYETEYTRIHRASSALHFISLVILSFMVLELYRYPLRDAANNILGYSGGLTISKFVCMGAAFLKKKFEVFDAFIVISSFALDFVFLDSRWYETGKDAATILVLLLPWRVVRIVNSFLMTVKHKHHIEMMNIKRAKKRAEFKNAKLQTLLTEIRKDVQLLVALCRNSRLPEAEITSCLYGLGRRSTTLNAVTSCTTIMLVSALGKDASLEDEIYGRLFADALRDPAEHDSEPEAKKAEEEAIDAAIELEKQLELQNKRAARLAIKPSKRKQVTRSYTVPRRSASIDNTLDSGEASAHGGSVNGSADRPGTIFYVNDGFASHRVAGRSSSGSGVHGGRRSKRKAGERGHQGALSVETLAGLAGGPHSVSCPLPQLSSPGPGQGHGQRQRQTLREDAPGPGFAGGAGEGDGGGERGGTGSTNGSIGGARSGGFIRLGNIGRSKGVGVGGGDGGGGGVGGGGAETDGADSGDAKGGHRTEDDDDDNGDGGSQESSAGGGGGGGEGSRESWEGRPPPKCKSKTSLRSLSGPGPGQNYLTFEVTTQVTYL